MKGSVLLLLFCCFPAWLIGQEPVYFFAEDGLKVRADLYLRDLRQPFIILCHQDGSNRSEYYDIAPRLLNLNYNCLAIDLRAGGKSGFIQNETATQAILENRPSKPIDASADIKAAIRYAERISNLPVILLGSSYSASLCLLAAADIPTIKAVIALSPGEYFQPQMNVGDHLRGIEQQVFVSATQTDYTYLQKMLSGIPADCLTLFKPEKNKGTRGTGALSGNSPASSEYWFALMMFFKKIG